MTTSLGLERPASDRGTSPVRDARPGRESLVARAALGVVALHIVDDSFLQPEPGTSAGDHLVSGLVPLAALALAGWAHPRLRGGTRAAIAGGLGVFGVITGVEAVYYAREVGASGDDYTGFLAIPAGLVLVGLAVITLWTSRRTDDRLRWRYVRRSLIVIGTAVAAYVVVVPLCVSYLFTHLARAVVPPAELGTTHEDVSFTTSDGLELRGWYIPSTNRAAVIAFPGRRGPQRHARMLARHGYGVLLFDRRGEGESEGDPNVFGWAGERDIRAAVEFLRGRPDVDPSRIGGIGLSVGGEMMIEAAAESGGPQAIVSDGAGIRSIRETLAIPDTRAKLEAALVHAVVTPGVALFSNTMPPPSLEDLSAEIAPQPVYFIYAKPGQGGEAELNQVFYDAAGQPKSIWLVPGADHTDGIETRTAEYERRVVGFFDQALLGDE